MTQHESSLIVECGNLKIDPKKIEAKIDDERIRLSLLEFKLLKYFVDHRETVLSRHLILDSVWKDTVVGKRTVDTHVSCLRKKLRRFNGRFFTIYGAGYTLRGP